MPSFTEDKAAKLADLTKIGLAEGEAVTLAGALSAASEEWDAVRDADVEGVRPWTQITWDKPWREDVVGASFSPEEATKASGRADAGLFLVPEIL